MVYKGIKEVNKMNKDVDPETLKPWEHYQKVKASWSEIVDRKTFNEVQDILLENLTTERRRMEDADKRIFLLSGALHCGECGRSLSGSSSHGRLQVHRYYVHADNRKKGTTCTAKRIRADDVEHVVINHITEIAGRAVTSKA